MFVGEEQKVTGNELILKNSIEPVGGTISAKRDYVSDGKAGDFIGCSQI